ncbi:intermediate filament protein A-like [Octopus sinensis]|uniref:Intermediate filament protein A-like n=1 Tax=Octopus sinensis TaxID=2607531 RepID=A0A7E6FIZ9_9MOLL|nr:intermediate filament protein A-like [Octopus sinensis]
MAEELLIREKTQIEATIQTKENTGASDEMGKEKKEMSELNSKLAKLLSRIGNLHEENKRLEQLLEKKIKTESEAITFEIKSQQDKTRKEKQEKSKELVAVKCENQSLIEEVGELQKQLLKMETQNNELKNEVSRCNEASNSSGMESELEEWKNRCNNLREKLKEKNTRNVELTNQVEELKDELDMKKDFHKAGDNALKIVMSDLQKISFEYRSEDYEKAIEDLRAEYEDIIADLKSTHEKEIKRLKSRDFLDGKERNKEILVKLSEYEIQIRTLEYQRDQAIQKSEHEKVTYERETEIQYRKLKVVTDDILSMKLQIAHYRKLLDVGEKKMDMKSIAASMGGYQTESEKALANALASAASKITMSRSTTEVVSIVELATDGTYIKLEDVGKSAKGAPNMKNWTLTQTLENGKINTHKFTDVKVFSSGKIVKIWGSKHGAGQDGITSSDVAEWGTMVIPSKIILKDDKGKEYSSLVIKIT